MADQIAQRMKPAQGPATKGRLRFQRGSTHKAHPEGEIRGQVAYVPAKRVVVW